MGHAGEFVDASVEAIVVKEVNCLFCDLEKNKKLKIHLRKEEDCRVKYLSFFNIENSDDALESIMKKINNQKRTLHPSRQANERRKENKKGVDTFLKEIALGSSVFICRNCGSTGSRKQMVVKDQENNEVIECKRCHWNLPEPDLPEKLFSNSVTEVDFSRILYPGILSGQRESNNLKFSTILLPFSYVDAIEIGFPRSPNSTQDHLYKMSRNGGTMDYMEYYPLIYENEIYKVGNCKVKGQVVPGYITNITKREICVRETDPSTKKVTGTKDYYEYNQDQMIHSFQQVGAVCLLTEVNVPYYSPAVLATQLTVNGMRKVDVDCSRLPETSYYVHSHDVDDECTDNCSLRNIEILRQRILGKEDEVISLVTVASYTQDFFRKFVLNIINDDQSALGAEFYDANLQFPLGCNHSKMVIASWPTALNQINSKIAKKEKFSKKEIDNYIRYVDSNLTTTLSPGYLEETFNLSTEDAELLSNLAREHQLRQNIDSCSQLPSQYTMMKFESIFKDNIQIIKKKNAFLSCIEARILCLEDSDLDSDVESFLLSIEDEEGFRISKDFEIISCVLPGDDEFVFPLEEKFSKIMENFGLTEFQALYHWALTFNQNSTFEVVLRSECLLDSFVEPFHPQYLLAVKSRVKSVFIGDHQTMAVVKLKSGQKELDVEQGHVLHKFDITHHQVSLLEGIFRFDRNKYFTLSNVNPLVVSITKERKLKFKKTECLNHENHFIDPKDNQCYEIFEDMYDKFLMKPAIYNKLVFFEFLGWFSRTEDMEENIDRNNEPERAPIMALCNDDSNGTNQRLPKIIRLSNNEVFKRRSRRKVIGYPLDKNTSLYTELVLFRPHTSREELENLDLNTMYALFNEKDQFPELNGLGDPLTKIQTVKLRSNGVMFDSKFNKCDNNCEFVEIYFDT